MDELALIMFIMFICSLLISKKLLRKDNKIGIYITIGICIFLMIFAIVANLSRYKYPVLCIDENSLFFIIVSIIIYLAPIIICYAYYKIKKDGKFVRPAFIIVMTFVNIITVMFTFTSYLFEGYLFESKTTNVENYLKFDSYVYHTSFLPKDISNFEVKEYYYEYYYNPIDCRYDIYIELKSSESDYQKIYDEISKNERKVMEKENKEYYAVKNENYGAVNYERNLGIIIFEYETKTITYQLTYQKHDHKVSPYKMSDKLYMDLIDEIHKK